MKVYILFHGYRNNCNGYPVAAFKSKKSVREFVPKKYPEFQGKHRIEPSEMYWESGSEWLKCEDYQVQVIE